jgi:hypothetical protein
VVIRTTSTENIFMRSRNPTAAALNKSVTVYCRCRTCCSYGPCGLPSLTPRALAAASAALVRSLILVRSCSATAA